MIIRDRFPGAGEGTYLNSCAHGLLPGAARDAMAAHLDRWTRDPSWPVWSEAVEAARKRFARFIGAHDDEVAVQASASTGLSAVLGALPADGPRRTVVTTDLDFPTTPVVAERATGRGLKHDHLRSSPADLDLDAWRRAVGHDTALACIPAVASFTGHRLDVPRFMEAAHAEGAPVLVDAFQALGTYPIDVHAWDVDFVVTGVYKWLLGAAGLAFLYVRRDLHDLEPTTGGWLAQDDPAAFDPFGPLAPDARRFQYGGPSVIACAGLPASLDVLTDVGLANVEKLNGDLVARVVDHARDRGFEVLTPDDADQRASIVTFRGFDAERALAACEREGVVVNGRLGGIRVSPHIYNTADDVDRLFEVLDGAL